MTVEEGTCSNVTLVTVKFVIVAFGHVKIFVEALNVNPDFHFNKLLEFL